MNTSAKKIIGIAGTLSSGKDTLAEYLENQKGFFHRSTSDMLRAEKKRIYGDSPEALLRRGDPFANNLRKEKGPGVLVELAYEDFLKSNSENLVVSGVRSIGEVEKLHEFGGILVFVDANAKVRFNRATGRGRDEQDQQTQEEFLAQEAIESKNLDPNDKTIQNLPAMKRLADVTLINEGTLEEFLAKADQVIGNN